jgi:hypothetical protein
MAIEHGMIEPLGEAAGSFFASLSPADKAHARGRASEPTGSGNR